MLTVLQYSFRHYPLGPPSANIGRCPPPFQIIKHILHPHPPPQNTTSSHLHQEHLHLQRVRIAQVSRTLLALTDDHTTSSATSSHMHILHMPTAATAATVRHTSTGINPPSSTASAATAAATCDANKRLKERIKQLGEDVLEKGQYIAILERERKTLIREVLHAQRGAPAQSTSKPRTTSTTTTPTAEQIRTKPHRSSLGRNAVMHNQVNF